MSIYMYVYIGWDNQVLYYAIRFFYGFNEEMSVKCHILYVYW